MATSGQYDISFTAKDVIDRAFAKVSVYDRFGDLHAWDFEQGRATLNGMMKQLQARQGFPTNREDAVVFLTKAQAEYTLSASGDHYCLAADAVTTTLSAAAVTGATTISLSSVAGLAASDNVIVCLSDGSNHTTTISSVGASNVVLASGLPSAAASGAAFHAYTSKAQTPVSIVGEWQQIRDKTGQDRNIWVCSADDYRIHTDKTQQGEPTQLSYERRSKSGRLRLWPTPADGESNLRLSVQYPLQIFVNSTDEADITPEFFEALVYGLAVRLSDEYAIPENDRRKLENEAERSMRLAFASMAETGDVRFSL